MPGKKDVKQARKADDGKTGENEDCERLSADSADGKEESKEGNGSKPKTLTFYPFAYALSQDELDNFCWYCLAENVDAKRCSGCKVAYFCGRDCLALGWLDHKAECKGFARNNGDVPTVETRMLGRIVARYKLIKNGKDSSDPHFYHCRTSERSIMDLANHSEDIRSDNRAYTKFQELYRNLVQFYGQKNLIDEETVFQLHCRNYINRHAISDADYTREIGKGLYLDLCAYNHSCAPNVIYTCKGFIATLNPLNDSVAIEDKNTTFYSYIDVLAHKAERRKLLKDTWYFHCECTRCVDDTEHVLTACLCQKCNKAVTIWGDKANKDMESMKLTCNECLETVPKDIVMEAVGAMRFIDGVLERDEISQMTRPKAKKFVTDFMNSFRRLLPPVNIYFAKLLQQAIFLCDPEEKDALLEYHLGATDCMRICFPQNHPALAYHLMNIGIFYCQLGKKPQGIPFLNEAQAMIHYTLGKDHRMARTIQEFLVEE